MKHIYIIFFVFGLVISLHAQVLTDLQKEKMLGHVKQVTTTTYDFKESSGDPLQKELDKKISFRYNTDGNKSEQNIFKKTGTLERQFTYTYNDKGFITEEDNFLHSEIYDYDEYGDQIKEDVYKTVGKKVLIKSYMYDDRGNQIAVRVSSPEGKVYNKNIYIYDDKNHQVETTEYVVDTILKKKTVCLYDEKGNQAETKDFLPGNKLEMKHLMKYDINGNQIERVDYNPDGSLSWKLTFKYDDRKNLTGMTSFDETGALYEKYVYTYDNADNIIQEDLYTGTTTTPSTTTYKYVYDNAGNWISKTRSFETPYDVEERVIEYY